MATLQSSISAQINLAPADYPLSKTLLPRQIEFLTEHVDEIVLSLDTQRGKGRFSSKTDTDPLEIRALVDKAQRLNDKVIFRPIDYSGTAQRAVAEFFRQDRAIPLRDLRGGPSYVYFYGLWSCSHDVVFHIDSDIFFGGEPGDWFARAIEELDSPGVFSVAPLAGPPTQNGSLQQPILDQICIEENREARRYKFDGFSTRLFMIDRRQLQGVRLSGRSSLVRAAKALGKMLAPFELPEVMISRHMRRHGLHRVDLGSRGNFYTLHPPYKSDSFFNQADRICRTVAEGTVPSAQCGRYDICDALYDFSPERHVLAQRAWYLRLLRGLGLKTSRNAA